MKLLRSLLPLCALVALALLAGCGGGGGGTVATTVQGLVSDALGVPLPGVRVTAGAATTTSGADGRYTLAVSPAASLKVAASKTGLAGTFDVVAVAAGQTVPVNFTLRAVGKSNPLIGMDTAQTVADSARNATVTLPAGSIVIAGTNTVVANATVDVTSALPNDLNYTENFPGLFVGTPAPGAADVAIESFGYVTIDVTSGGQKCNLGAGKTATIDFPVDPAADPGTATIDLWSLDEATGKWIHEGVADRIPGPPVMYRATVDHFSTYNLDRAIVLPLPFVITVENEAGAKIAGASVTITSTNQSGGGRWESRGTTGANGTVTFPQVPQGQVAVSVVAGSQAGSGYSYDVAGNQATMTVTVFTAVRKTFTLVYNDGTGEKPAGNVNASVMAEGNQGHNFVNGTTTAAGVVTLNLRSGMPFYMYNASIAVGPTTYSISGNTNSLDAIPAKWVLVAPQPLKK